MRNYLRFLPFALFFLFYALIQISFTSLRTSREKEDAQETRVFEDVVIDRFQRYLELPYMMTVLGSQFLSHGDLMTVNYEAYASLVLKANSEFLGFNVMNDKGVIVRTYPGGNNAKALGRVSQNLGPLLESLGRKEEIYLSPPFRLFQGKQGFVFYRPIEKNKTLKGWYAVVISSEDFIHKFSLQDFIELFDVTIVDVASGLDYFATSLEPQGAMVFQKRAEFYGRKVVFKTWRKHNNMIYQFPWYFSVIMALALSLASALLLRFYNQRKKASAQLENVSILLRVTSKEALTNLIEIHRELNELHLPEGENVDRLGRDINYLTNLIEQIDLLQTMAHNREGLMNAEHTFLTLLKNQLENFSEVLDRKNIKVSYKDDELEAIILQANMWLFENSVLSNVFSHLLIYTESGSTIQIQGKIEPGEKSVVFRTKRIPSMNLKTVTRRIEVAKKVLQLHDGDLKEEVTMDEIILTVICHKF